LRPQIDRRQAIGKEASNILTPSEELRILGRRGRRGLLSPQVVIDEDEDEDTDDDEEKGDQTCGKIKQCRDVQKPRRQANCKDY
jgi:hypothetical protein